MDLERFLVEAFRFSILELINLVGPLIVIGLILGLMERKANSNLFATFGYKGILATAWIGTPVHEMGHALMCLIFGHKIINMRLLMIDRADGTLGYVTHSYNRRSVYQTLGNFFIGIAPIISGIGALFLSLYYLLPNSFKSFEVYLHMQENVMTKAVYLTYLKGFVSASFVLAQNIFTLSNLFNLHFWIFLLIAIGISSHMALSGADIKGGAHGLVSLYLVIFSLTMIANFMHVNAYNYISQVTQYNAYLLAFSALALIFSSFTLGLSFIVYQIKITKS
ncbi:MAG: hypothetical protein P4L49_16475 [Desulfosporosinus sp.]|nr:hypothetical protein [Desulfosporosinus sp.]